MKELSLASCSRSSIDPLERGVKGENCNQDPGSRDRRVWGPDLGNY